MDRLRPFSQRRSKVGDDRIVHALGVGYRLCGSILT